MPIDVNLLRKEKGGNPDLVLASQAKRCVSRDYVGECLALDEAWRKGFPVVLSPVFFSLGFLFSRLYSQF